MNYQNATLPKFLAPLFSEALCRLGKDNDGGYLVSELDLTKCKGLVSFGISDDWSFEKAFFGSTKLPCIAFDGSLTKVFWMKQIIRSLLKLNLIAIFKIVDFKLFFRGKRKFTRKFLGSEISGDFIDLNYALDHISSSPNSIFLKIDIEGSEYRILEDILDNQERIAGLAIEFHDADLHIGLIKSFVERFSLDLCHAHANNYGTISPNNSPTTIELSFSSSMTSNNIVSKFPHKLDQPNNPLKPEIVLGFE